jgi:hypothetical protein
MNLKRNLLAFSALLFIFWSCTPSPSQPAEINGTQVGASASSTAAELAGKLLTTPTPTAAVASAFRGYTITLPDGWNMVELNGGIISGQDQQRSAQILVHPVFLRSGVSAIDYLRSAPSIYAGVFPQAQVGPVEFVPGSETHATAELSFERAGAPWKVLFLAAVQDRSGMVYAVSAPADRLYAVQGRLAQILKTFRFTPLDELPKGVAQYSLWTDPNERAFSLELPTTWTAAGGLFRYGEGDTRPEVTATSPDGQIILSMGDKTLPVFILPNPTLVSQGFQEGAVYNPGGGFQMVVRHYQDGLEFAQAYVNATVAGKCSALRIGDGRARSDLARSIHLLNIPLRSNGIPDNLNCGEVNYTCQVGNLQYNGYTFACTASVTAVTAGVWVAPYLYSYLATPDHETQAKQTLAHMAASWRDNPEWIAKSLEILASEAEPIVQAGVEANRVISGAYLEGAGVQPEPTTGAPSAEDLIVATLRQLEVVDSISGQRWSAAGGGHNYYWQREGVDAYPEVDLSPLEKP